MARFGSGGYAMKRFAALAGITFAIATTAVAPAQAAIGGNGHCQSIWFLAIGC